VWLFAAIDKYATLGMVRGRAKIGDVVVFKAFAKEEKDENKAGPFQVYGSLVKDGRNLLYLQSLWWPALEQECYDFDVEVQVFLTKAKKAIGE
jgi:hypothetical protein